MKKSKITYIIIIIGLLISSFSIGYKSKTLPEIKTGSETTLIKVIVHDTDTVKTIKTEKEIQVIHKIDTIKISDSTSNSIQDTTICYSFDQKEPDGTYIRAEICSDSLPPIKPLDLTGNIYYVPKPDSIREIFKTDTIEKKKGWIFYTSLCVGTVLSGFLIGSLVR